MPYKDITPPAGDKITRGQTLSVPDHPVIPFIRGDGTGPDIWAASVRVFDDTVDAFREYLVGIKGPLTTPVGGGIRSLNVALRQLLDLYVCLRPVQYFKGVPSPVKRPEKVDMIIFRENTEDIYAGIDFEADSEPALKILEFLKTIYPKEFKKI